ncbi:MAG TPA: elongation factor G, partial [Ottowia sp.]|nr:elongation factor G [Ottowia sp.]
GKIDELHYDAVLHDAAEDAHIHLRPLPFPVPVHGVALRPKKRGDEQRLWEIVGKLVAEDPCLKIERVASTNETVVYGLGELHLRVLLERLRDGYKFEVDTQPPRIAYRETIAQAAAAQYRHKKQSGGAGQFGEVHLRVEPLPRGAGFEFVDQVKGGTIPGQFMPAVEKGVREALAEGVIAGFQVQDIRVIVHDGKHHAVDSKEVAFVTAGKKAVQAAIRDARPTVLEPIARIAITAPDSATGALTGDLSSRRGIVSGTDSPRPGQVAITAQVPLAELSSYQMRLDALTAGQGAYTLALSHYEVVPPQVQQQLAGQYRVKEEE